MAKNQFKSFILCSVVILFGAAAAFAQQSITAEKRKLIFELRELTGTKTFKVVPEMKTEDIGNVLVRLVDSDRELSTGQKQELRKTALAAKERFEKEMLDYMADGTVSDELFDEIFVREYDKAFTEDELREIVVFYRTPAGKKSAGFFMRIMNQATKDFAKALTVKINEFVNTKLKEEIERLKKEIERAKVASGDA